jgi:hypothetical protein
MAIQGPLRFVLALELMLGWMGMGCQDLIAETGSSRPTFPKILTTISNNAHQITAHPSHHLPMGVFCIGAAVTLVR